LQLEQGKRSSSCIKFFPSETVKNWLQLNYTKECMIWSFTTPFHSIAKSEWWDDKKVVDFFA